MNHYWENEIDCDEDKWENDLMEDGDIRENHITDKKLRRGNVNVDIVVDFHGLNLREAFSLLVETINSAYKRRLRCILFITGKGRNSNSDETIKNSMDRWLRHQFVADKIIKHVPAAKKDGGDGALYVILKKDRGFR
jgi:DNA-nicking Smr family endonuclease